MKNLLSASFVLAVLISCTPKPTETAVPDIKVFENNLVPIVHFAEDSAWNIEERMKHYGVAGASIAVIKDRKILWVKAYGIMDRETNEPVTTKTLFQAGSISKPVAAYAALKTVELGKVNLDEDVNTWLTTWKIPDNEFTLEKKVSLTHLVSHTGGLTVHGFLGYSPDLPVPTLVQVLNGEQPANSAPIRVDKVPGGDFRYSGGGYCVMQQMLIDVHGKTFPAVTKELVLGPLQMDNSTYDQPLDEVTVKLAATGYVPGGAQTKGKRHTYPEMAAAGLWTTAEDLAKFAIDIQSTLAGEGSKVLSKDMVSKMVTPVNGGFIGLGIFINDRDGEIYFGHGGWDEGFSSELTAHRDKGYGIVVLTNANEPPFIGEVIRAAARTYNWDYDMKEYKKQPIDTSMFKTIRGRYRNGSDGRITISTEGDKLFFKFIRSDKPFEVFRIADNEYITAQSDDSFKFNTKDNGEVDLYFESGPIGGSHPKVKDDERIPYEYLLAGEFDKALKGYQAIMKSNPNDNSINEGGLNNQGYDKLGAGETKLAQDIFKINTALYPTSANAFDSYAEACMKNGDNKAALANYKKSLSLDPKNENAKKKIAELENVSK